MEKCDVCGNNYSTAQGLNAHKRVHKPKNQIKTKVSKKSKAATIAPKIDPAESQMEQILKTEGIPSDDTFSSWLDEPVVEETTQTIAKTQEEIEQQSVFTKEMWISFLELLNTMLDNMSMLLGGDEVFQGIKKNTLGSLAQQLKSYTDSKNISISPGKMLVITFGMTYAYPTSQMVRSIVVNRKKRIAELKEAKKNQIPKTFEESEQELRTGHI